MNTLHRLTQIMLVVLMLILGLGFCAIGMAADAAKTAKAPVATVAKPVAPAVEPAVPEAPKEKIEVENKTLSGRVSGVSKNFIAVEYGMSPREESVLEMAFNIDKDVIFEGTKKIEQIVLGDIVQVKYEVTTKTIGEGLEAQKFRSHVAKSVKFLKPAPPELSSGGE